MKRCYPMLDVTPTAGRPKRRYCDRGHDKADVGAWKGRCKERRCRYKENRLKSDAIKRERGCERCGYNKCLTALHYHHREPSQKVEEMRCA